MIERINGTTFIIWFAFVPIWLAWEAVLLKLRGEKVNVLTISQVARARGWQMSSVVYAYNGMSTHWWWNADVTALVWTSVLFWVVGVGLAIWDITRWGATDRPWFRSPKIYVVSGLAAGAILFPQVHG